MNPNMQTEEEQKKDVNAAGGREGKGPGTQSIIISEQFTTEIILAIYSLFIMLLMVVALYSYRLDFYKRRRNLFVVIFLYVLCSAVYMFIYPGETLSPIYLIGIVLLFFDLSASLIYYGSDMDSIYILKKTSNKHKVLYIILKMYDFICDYELMEAPNKVIRFFTGPDLYIIKVIYIIVIIFYIYVLARIIIVEFYHVTKDRRKDEPIANQTKENDESVSDGDEE